MRKILFISLLSILIANVALAEVAYIKPSLLADESDLIIVGNVDKIEKTQDKTKDYWGYPAFIKYAEISVKEVLKGNSASKIIVKFVYEVGEADVQDANLEEEKGKTVLLYLKLNNDKRNSYSVVDGWSGVGRFHEGKFYHQYFEADFDDYIAKLKDHLKQN